MNQKLLEKWSPDTFLKELSQSHYTSENFSTAPSHESFEAQPQSPSHELLLRLFLAGEVCPPTSVQESLPKSFPDLLAIGILAEEQDGIRSCFRLRACPEGYFMEDFPARLLTSADDFVMGVAPTTRIVRRLIPDFGPKTVLDLCCGGGWLALTQATDDRKVTACDLNPRALEIAQLNARLLKISSVDWRQGPWMEPVIDEKFDLIISNPPFVQSPGSTSVALDTPEKEDMAASLVPYLADHLNSKGFACILLDWQFTSPDEWQKYPESLIPTSGVQSLLFEIKRYSPVEYAHHWLKQDSRFQESSTLSQETKRWLDYFSSKGTGGLSSGFLILRKCEPGEEFHLQESRQVAHFSPETSLEIGRLFRNHEWIHNQTEDLLDQVFSGVPGVRKTEGSLSDGQEWDTEFLQLSSPAKLLYDGHIDPALLAILETASEGKPIRSILPKLAQMVGSTPENITTQVRELIRELVSRTLIEPATKKIRIKNS